MTFTSKRSPPTMLSHNYKVARGLVDQPSYDSVVLQDASFEPIKYALSRNHKSDSQAFCNSVQTVEQGIHAAAPSAEVFLYSTWPPADTSYLDVTANGTFSLLHVPTDLNTLTAAYQDVGRHC
jgi:hypothetical protein